MVIAASIILAASLGQVAYDGFGNGPRPSLDGSAGGAGWAGPWTDVNSSQFTSVGGPGLVYPGLATTPGAAVTPQGGSFDAARLYRNLPPIPPGTTALYVSFLLRPDAVSSYGGISYGAYPRTVMAGYPLGQYVLGLRWGRYVFQDTLVPHQVGRTDLIVLEMTPGATSTTYRLYIDPTVGAPKPQFPSAEYTAGGVEPWPTLIYLDNDGGFTTDELRVATTWEEAVPHQTPPCPVDLGSPGGVPGPDGALDNNDFITFIAYFFSQNPAADVGAAGGFPGHDGHFDNNDFIAFISLFFAGC